VSVIPKKDSAWRPIIKLATLFIIATAAAIYVFLKYDELVIYRDVGNIGAMTDAERAREFEREYPTADQISNYLNDATVVVSVRTSKPEAARQIYGNTIFYLDSNNRYYAWDAGNPYGRYTSRAGNWSISPHFLISKFHDKRRYRWVQVICIFNKYMAPQFQAENCEIVSDFKALPLWGNHSSREYRKGNVFGVSGEGDLPFSIPNNAPVTMDSLISLSRSSSGKE
jgi:hypothetical protein